MPRLLQLQLARHVDGRLRCDRGRGPGCIGALRLFPRRHSSTFLVEVAAFCVFDVKLIRRRFTDGFPLCRASRGASSPRRPRPRRLRPRSSLLLSLPSFTPFFPVLSFRNHCRAVPPLLHTLNVFVLHPQRRPPLSPFPFFSHFFRTLIVVVFTSFTLPASPELES